MAFQSLQSLVEKYLNSGDFADLVSNTSNGIVGALNDNIDNYFKNNTSTIDTTSELYKSISNIINEYFSNTAEDPEGSTSAQALTETVNSMIATYLSNNPTGITTGSGAPANSNHSTIGEAYIDSDAVTSDQTAADKIYFWTN